MAETLNDSNRELNFLQFGGEGHTSISKSGIILNGFSSEIMQNSNLEFTISFSNSDYNCGDLYITISDITLSEEQVLTQSGYLKQCFIQNNNLLPVDDTFSELISKPGTYEIYIEIFDQTYSKSTDMTKTLLVK